ncbi:MAG: AzlC family ABC transporter permease [Oscillospiraceae bacterium]|nr:AzlC family ABC transporter permease [Oscillospiraceae bacterium]
MKEKNVKTAALRAALPHTLPIMAGFLFLGAAYGVYARTAGFGALLPIGMALTVFAGSMEFVAVNLLQGVFNPLNALLMTLMVNARHLFYGISMLDKYRRQGKKRWYLIFGMCDESFSINCTADIPDGVDEGWFYFFVTALNQLYWVAGAAIGSLAGGLITVELKGLDFVMTALLVVIFLDNFLKEKQHFSSVVGIASSLVCLLLLGSDGFILPSMAAILIILTALRKPIERAYDGKESERK